jgi:hypothetical protein
MYLYVQHQPSNHVASSKFNEVLFACIYFEDMEQQHDWKVVTEFVTSVLRKMNMSEIGCI